MEDTVPALVKNLELTHGPGNPNFYMSHSVEANQVAVFAPGWANQDRLDVISEVVNEDE